MNREYRKWRTKAARWLQENHHLGAFKPDRLYADPENPSRPSPGIPRELARAIMLDLKEKRLVVEKVVHDKSYGYEVNLGAPGWDEVLRPQWASFKRWLQYPRSLLVTVITAFITSLVTVIATAAVAPYILKWIGLP